MIKRAGYQILFFSFFCACYSGQQKSLPADKHATTETIHLYHHLKAQLKQGIMFGHQDDLAYGVHWKYQPGRSDIKDITGDYPAVYGWELGHLELDATVNLDSVPFSLMRNFIKQGYQLGAVITISWHLNNPLTGKSSWDPFPETVSSILPGAEKNEVYKSWLDKLAVFLAALKGDNGEMIPVIFRPFHEWNGSWFWWGKHYCTADQFIELWKFTVTYLRDVKKLHHLLYAFNTDKFYSKEEYLERYPGDKWVDLIGFDIYQRDMSREVYMQEFDRMLAMLESVAAERNKLPALTEFGGNHATDSSWWTETFFPVLEKHTLSFVLGWRNAGLCPNGEMEYYVPYKGGYSENNFIKFYQQPKMIFGKEVAANHLYQ